MRLDSTGLRMKPKTTGGGEGAYKGLVHGAPRLLVRVFVDLLEEPVEPRIPIQLLLLLLNHPCAKTKERKGKEIKRSTRTARHPGTAHSRQFLHGINSNPISSCPEENPFEHRVLLPCLILLLLSHASENGTALDRSKGKTAANSARQYETLLESTKQHKKHQNSTLTL